MHKEINPRQQHNAVLLRQAGYAVSAIADKTKASPSALFALFKRLDVKKGTLKIESLENAQEQLLSDAGFIGSLRDKIAAQIVADLSIGKALQDSITLTIERLNDTEADVSSQSRSLAALSTALKTSSEVLRRSLNIDNSNVTTNDDEIPKLYVMKMTEAEEDAAKNRMKTSGLAVVKDDDDD